MCFCVHHVCAWYLRRPDFLGLDLQSVVNHHMGTGNWIRVILKNSCSLNCWDISPSLLFPFFCLKKKILIFTTCDRLPFTVFNLTKMVIDQNISILFCTDLPNLFFGFVGLCNKKLDYHWTNFCVTSVARVGR